MDVNISNKEHNFLKEVVKETAVWQFFSALLFSNIIELSWIQLAYLLAKCLS